MAEARIETSQEQQDKSLQHDLWLLQLPATACTGCHSLTLPHGTCSSAPLLVTASLAASVAEKAEQDSISHLVEAWTWLQCTCSTTCLAFNDWQRLMPDGSGPAAFDDESAAD